MKKVFVILLILSHYAIYSQNWTSSIVPVVNGKLTYITDVSHNRIPDYSYAGYNNGLDDFPNAPVKVIISPAAGDRTADIQAAINQVENMLANTDNMRGTVELEAGLYLVEGTLFIQKSGVVLKGKGDGENIANNTLIYRDNPNNDLPIIKVGNDISWNDQNYKITDTQTNITTDFVQVGSRSFEVEDASHYNVGDHIVIYHPDSEEWLAAVDYGNTGTHESSALWEQGQLEVNYDRYITAINDNTISIDAPVFMHLDKSLSHSYIYKVNENALSKVENVGIEKLRITVKTNGNFAEDHALDFIRVNGAHNCWFGEITGLHFKRSLFKCSRATRITIFNCKALEPHSKISGGRRYNYFMGDGAQLILVKNSFSTYGRHDMTCGGSSIYSATNSGNVFHNNKVLNTFADSDNHVRWVQGTFHDMNEWIDPETKDDIVLSFGNRGPWSGNAGYSSVFATAWNCKTNSERINIQGVPNGQNYAVGCHADAVGNFPMRTFFGVSTDAYVEGTNIPHVYPCSLYLAQLRQRLDTLHRLNKDEPENIPISSIHIFNGDRTIRVNEQLRLVTTVVPADASNQIIYWEADNNSVLSVNEGIITGLIPGRTIVRAFSSDGSICDTTEISVVGASTSVSDNDLNKGEKGFIYPNPCIQGMPVYYNAAEIKEIVVYSIDGKLVQFDNSRNGYINTSGFIKGIYIIKTESMDGLVQINKLIIK